MSDSERFILPNLGAEEGSDWDALRRHPAVRVAARLWSTLFSGGTLLCRPASDSTDDRPALERQRCADLWPSALGPAPRDPVFDGLEHRGRSTAWLPTPTLAETSERELSCPLAGPSPEAVVAAVHDKAFALETARQGGLLPARLEPLLRALPVEALLDAESFLPDLEESLRDWPGWTRGRFTLKPRFGGSGRGRVGGTAPDRLDRAAIRAALPRLARRGGAILEPWLERRCDLSACILVPPPSRNDALPTLLGSLEMIVTRAGSFRGHCGEIDARGRVYSGHRLDEEVRSSSAWLAGRARERGFFGPCGVDAFTYVEEDRERLRPAVELNARHTMGLVSIGLVRRALPQVREALGLAAENRRAFLLTLLSPGTTGRSEAEAIAGRAGGRAEEILRLRLTAGVEEAGDPTPTLFFGREREPLREAHRFVMGC